MRKTSSLIALGAGVAWLFSVVACVLPRVFPHAFHDAHGRVVQRFAQHTAEQALATNTSP